MFFDELHSNSTLFCRAWLICRARRGEGQQLVAPGGVGVRETVLVGLLTSLRLATPADAVLLATTSRIWLTVLEILPGLVFLPGTSLRRRSSISTPDGPAA